ncbi:MAG: nucleotidyltransferase family protein, partial [Candidatus Micrarchaeaceae archaeon]
MVVGVILAGGNGKRLMPLTENLPKALLEVKKGWSILHHQLNEFKNAGIFNVYLLISNKSAIIQEKLGNEWNGITLNYLNEKEPKGTLFAMDNCFRQLNEDSVVRNGDIVSDINLKKLIDFAQSSNYDMVMALTKLRSPYGIVDLNGTAITNFVEKPLIDKYINAGIYYISKKVYPYFRIDKIENNLNKKLDVENSIFPILASEGKIGAYIENDVFWQSVDTLKDIERVMQDYANKNDTEYGYERKTETSMNIVNELYIKAGYKDYAKQANSFETIKVIAGSGYIKQNNETIKLSKGL